MKRKIALLIVLSAALGLSAGCGTIYTQRTLGPQQALSVIPSQATFEDVLQSYGAPTEIYDREGGGAVCVYKSIKYFNILGIYAREEKTDLVLTFVDGRLTDKQWVPTGTTMAILAAQSFTLGVNAEE